MKPPPSAPPEPWKEFSTLAQSSGDRQMPSVLEEESQPAAPPSKPRAALADGYLLLAAPAAAGIASSRAAKHAATTVPARRWIEVRIGFSSCSLLARTGDYRVLSTQRKDRVICAGRT